MTKNAPKKPQSRLHIFHNVNDTSNSINDFSCEDMFNRFREKLFIKCLQMK